MKMRKQLANLRCVSRSHNFDRKKLFPPSFKLTSNKILRKGGYSFANRPPESFLLPNCKSIDAIKSN